MSADRQHDGRSGPPAESQSAGRDERPVDRRRFLTWLWTGLGLIAAAEIVWVWLSFLRPRRRAAARAASLLVCGPAAEFAPGTVTAFPAGRFYLARLDGGIIVVPGARLRNLTAGCDEGRPPVVRDKTV